MFLQEGILGSFTYPFGDCIGTCIAGFISFKFYLLKILSYLCLDYDLILTYEPILFMLFIYFELI